MTVSAEAKFDETSERARATRAFVEASDADVLLAALAILQGQRVSACMVERVGLVRAADYLGAAQALLAAMAIALDTETN